MVETPKLRTAEERMIWAVLMAGAMAGEDNETVWAEGYSMVGWVDTTFAEWRERCVSDGEADEVVEAPPAESIPEAVPAIDWDAIDAAGEASSLAVAVRASRDGLRSLSDGARRHAWERLLERAGDVELPTDDLQEAIGAGP